MSVLWAVLAVWLWMVSRDFTDTPKLVAQVLSAVAVVYALMLAY